MATCYPLIRGRAMRVTRLNGCGTPLVGSRSVVVTKGFISVGLTAQTEDGEEINVTNANGDICIYDSPAPRLLGYDLSISLCGVDPDLIGLLTGQSMVEDFGNPVPDSIGFRVNTGVNLDNSGFALELWTGIAGSACAAGAQSYGYLLIPFVKGGVLGDFTVENGAVNFTVQGAKSKDGSAWGVGPFNVVPGNGTNEAQTLTITGTPTGGSFTLTFNGQQTQAINYNATAANVKTALVNLSNIGPDDVVVTGGPGPGTPWVVTFQGQYSDEDVALMTDTESFTGGIAPALAITTSTPGVPGVASVLTKAIDPKDHLHVQVTTIAPPTDQCGGQALGSEATGATEVVGTAATLTPANTYAPYNITDANEGDFIASPLTLWSSGSYVTLENGNKIHWNSTTWVPGAAP